MASSFRIQSVLAEHHGEKLQGHRVARFAGISVKTFHKMAAELVRKDEISRMKLSRSVSAYYWYYLSEEQLRRYSLKKAMRDAKSSEAVILPTDTAHFPGILAFLRMLKEKTVYGEHAILHEIIRDYECTLKMRRSIEQRAEAAE